MGKTGQTGLGLASLNSFSVLRSQGLLLVGTWPWGFLGRERVALSGPDRGGLRIGRSAFERCTQGLVVYYL